MGLKHEALVSGVMTQRYIRPLVYAGYLSRRFMGLKDQTILNCNIRV